MPKLSRSPRRTSSKTRRSSAPRATKKTTRTKRTSKKTVTVVTPAVQTPVVTAKLSHALLWWRVLGLTVALNLIIAGGWWILYRETVLSFAASPVISMAPELRGSLPLNIAIPKLAYQADLHPTAIENGVWQTSATNPTYLVSSARPGEPSNIVVYGHNTKAIFANLTQLQVGDQIEVTTQQGKVHTYQVQTIKVVTPKDVSVIYPTESEVLTVYTCTGPFDAQRLVLTAEPVSVSSN